METLADFGVSSYFGIQTFTAGIYKAWLSMDNRIAAAQLATVLLFFVALLLWIEHGAQKRMRFATGRGARAGAQDAAPVRLQGARALAAWAVCAVPIALGFVLPVLFMFLLGKVASASQKERFLSKLVSGEARSAFFMADRASRSGVVTGRRGAPAAGVPLST